MKRRNKLFVVAGVLLALVFAIIYFAFPRLLLKVVVALQRSSAGIEHRWVQVQNWRLPYIESRPQGNINQGTVLLVHGFGDTKDRFIDLADQLSNDGYHVVAADLPGFGESAIRMDEDYSAAFYVDCILELIEKLDIDSVHLVGYSMGGMLAAKVAAHAPNRVRTLTLLAPSGLQGDQTSELESIISEQNEIPLIYRDRESFVRLMQLNFNQQLDVPDFAIRAIVSEGRERADLHELIFKKLFDPSDAAAFEEQIRTLRMPTLLIWGREDQILDVSAADRWSRAIPGVRVVKLPNVGHALVYQRPERILKEIRSHISVGASSQ